MTKDGTMPRVRWFLISLLTWVAQVPAEEPLDFNRDIRPILSEACIACHGPDEHHREGGLRLDLREGAIAQLESGVAAIVPKDPAASEMIARITSTDADIQMPPPKSGKKLKPAQIELLKKWIAQGANYAKHWSFVAPVRPALPAMQKRDWPRNEIDHFILARLEKEGLQPSAEASKTTLLRRLSLDLIGLPPTLAELDAFLQDESPNAYEKQVDRLLSSPHYGERMAMNWLDFARYADSNGFQTDSSRQMWPWRDWVIRAYNENMPFDQFTIEQLAGDMLPDATLSQQVATGFNRNHRINGEGGIIAEEWRIENIMDRVETTSVTWMGLTLGCARCHDHKYDPISQKEFYQFFSLFNNVPESGTIMGASNRSGGNSDPLVFVPSQDQEEELKNLATKVASLEQQLATESTKLKDWQQTWEAKFKTQLNALPVTWTPLEPRNIGTRDKKTKFTRQPDGSWLASGKNPDHDVYTVTASVSPGVLSGVLLEAFPDDSLPNKSLGRYANGNFVLSGVKISVSAPGMEQPIEAKVQQVEADYSQQGWEIKLLLDDSDKNGWAVDGPTKIEPRKAMFVFEHALTVPKNATVSIQLQHEALGGHNIGRFRLSTSSLDTPLVKLNGDGGPPEKVVSAVNTPAEKRTKAQQTELANYVKTVADYPLRDIEASLSAAKKARDEVEKKFPSTMVMKELPQPRDTRFLIRGQYDHPGEKVEAGLPSALPPLPAGEKLNRLGMARWLVSPQHPLTARVQVNRFWEKFFGTGLVKTSENMGSQAEFPSHPELLDWLATEFMHGWDMKTLQKKIVMSATYRQASSVSAELATRDPENRLLARGPRFRLSGELVRDNALALSQLLVNKIGGPSVRPYMPQGVWDETSVYGDLLRYQPDKGENLYRRTMYTIWKRTAAPPTMLIFDSPSREFCAAKRSRTNTPLQALALLNEVTFVEAARGMAESMLRSPGTPAERLTTAFRAATSRAPTAEELRVLVAGWERRLAKYKADIEAAKKLITLGDHASDPQLDPAELAAYTLTANVILNLDEVVTKE
jgi:mono/diheme cytochrome c family protein